MARLTAFIKSELIRLRTNTDLSYKDIHTYIKREHNFETNINSVIRFLSKPETKSIMIKVAEPLETPKEVIRNQYLDISSELQCIKGKCALLLNKSLDNILELPNPEEHLMAIGKVLNDIIKYESYKELQYKKMALDIEKFNLEKSKTVFDEDAQQYNIKIVNDLGELDV